MKKRLLRKKTNQALYLAQKKEAIKKRKEAFFRISGELHDLKKVIKTEKSLSLAEKKKIILEESGPLWVLMLIADVVLSARDEKKELEAIQSNEERLQRFAEKPLQEAYQKRMKLRKMLVQLGR